MAIEFNRPGGNVPAASGQGTPATRKTETADSSLEPGTLPASASDTSGESVELSPQAQRLQQITADAQALPDIDVERVESIRQSIADGSYAIDPESIASKMIGQELER